MDLTPALAAAWIDRFAAEIEQNKDHLTELDGPIGDNDHGINMDRGMRAVHASLTQAGTQPIEVMLKAAGMTLIRSVGGASGPLYGTVLLRMAQATSGHDSLDAATLGQALEAGRQGIIDRGKAEPGDMTMLDAWDPAVRAYQEAVSGGQDLPRAVAAATQAAEAGMEATIPLVARKGRASYLGERSVGHQDPGATSSYLLFKALQETVG
ncbi:MAG: dihydroxyacetone kinase subunit DhaL [Actinomycetota bacterium]|nr:dihydroxyacetone kinase subunit DhaL [Actinomycetota bacterium]